MTITVIRAVYGTATNGTDVTKIVQDRLDKGNDDVYINNDAFGDPGIGTLKYFGIVYKQPNDDITEHVRCGVENTKLELVD